MLILVDKHLFLTTKNGDDSNPLWIALLCSAVSRTAPSEDPKGTSGAPLRPTTKLESKLLAAFPVRMQQSEDDAKVLKKWSIYLFYSSTISKCNTYASSILFSTC